MKIGEEINIEDYKEVKGKDMAERLGVAESTVRKYSGILDEKGYKFRRNSKNHRIFRDEDEEVLALMVEITQKGNWRPHEAADMVIARISGSAAAEQTVKSVTQQTNEVDLAEKFEKRIQHYIEEKVEKVELLAEKSHQEYLHISENMMTKEDASYIKDFLIEQVKTQEEENKRLKERVEMLEKANKKGFWARLFNL